MPFGDARIISNVVRKLIQKRQIFVCMDDIILATRSVVRYTMTPI